MTETIAIIPLKEGVSISWKKKKYSGYIPEDIFKEINGNLGSDPADSEKIYKERLKKFKAVSKKDDAKK